MLFCVIFARDISQCTAERGEGYAAFGDNGVDVAGWSYVEGRVGGWHIRSEADA